MANQEPLRDDDLPDAGEDPGRSPAVPPANADTCAESVGEGTTRWSDGPLPPPPCPVPAGVERVARALSLSSDAGLPRVFVPVSIPGYEILGELGRGGMGVVYHARHIGLSRDVAVKMVLHGPQATPQEMRRLRTEAESIARLQHPHIVQIFEVGEIDGCPYCALEYVDGGSLADQIRGTPQPFRAAVECAAQLSQALAYAHQRGILHRDLKPSNVLLTREGIPKVTDFGLAKQCEVADNTLANETMPTGGSLSQVAGTPSYMAPELLRWNKQPLQPTVDVYGLGAILYELLTGRPPFQAESPQETLLQSLFDDPIPPTRLQPKLPRDLDTICLKCLAKDPGRRYATAQSLHDDLCRFLEGKPISARPVPAWERTLKWARRRPATAALLVCAAAVTMVLLLVGWVVAGRERQQARLLEAERNLAIQERNEKNVFLQKSFAAAEQLKDLADAMAALPEGQLRQQLQEERLRVYLDVVRQPSADPLIARERARTFERLGDIYRSLKKRDEALTAQRRANEIFLNLMRQEPQNETYAGDYAIGLDRLGLLLKQNQEFAEAERVLREGIARAEQLVIRAPRTARYHSTLGTMLNNLAVYLYDSNDVAQLSQAHAMLVRAIETQQRAVALDDNPLFSMFLRNHHGALTEVLLRQGHYAEAADVAQRLPTFFPDDALDYKRAADFLDRCRRLAAEDATIDVAERDRRAAQYADEHARLMDQAIRHGYKRPSSRGQT